MEAFVFNAYTNGQCPECMSEQHKNYIMTIVNDPGSSVRAIDLVQCRECKHVYSREA